MTQKHALAVLAFDAGLELIDVRPADLVYLLDLDQESRRRTESTHKSG